MAGYFTKLIFVELVIFATILNLLPKISFRALNTFFKQMFLSDLNAYHFESKVLAYSSFHQVKVK